MVALGTLTAMVARACFDRCAGQLGTWGTAAVVPSLRLTQSYSLCQQGIAEHARLLGLLV